MVHTTHFPVTTLSGYEKEPGHSPPVPLSAPLCAGPVFCGSSKRWTSVPRYFFTEGPALLPISVFVVFDREATIGKDTITLVFGEMVIRY